MPKFKPMQAPQYPPRQWAIYGAAGSGKSHFASQMKTPALVIDADARFTEQLGHAAGMIYQLSDEHADNTDPDSIARLLRENLPGSGVRTIVVDSLTAILRPKINAAMSDIEHGRAKNKIAAFRDKALSMSLLQDAIASSGADCLWIWHTHESMNAQAQKIMRASIPETELVRLRRSLNVILRLDVSDDGKRTVLIEWARNGTQGMRLTDNAGGWRGMPELIEQAVYAKGVKRGDETPTSFSGPADAIAWGYEKGCFNASQHAQNAYEELKRLQQPKSPAEMWRLWIAEVERRVLDKDGVPSPAELATESDGDKIFA
jgi:hypothetical protein